MDVLKAILSQTIVFVKRLLFTTIYMWKIVSKFNTTLIMCLGAQFNFKIRKSNNEYFGVLTEGEKDITRDTNKDFILFLEKYIILQSKGEKHITWDMNFINTQAF